MKNIAETGLKNKRPSTKLFSAWVEKINDGRDENLFGIDKYIINVEKISDVTSITTFNGSVYTISYNENSHNDLVDLIGYKVTFYPKRYESYELEAYFLWNWDNPAIEQSFGYLFVNRVLDVKIVGADGLIFFENGDELPIPFKDYEKPYFRASKRLHGDDTYRDGYAIDFDANIKKIRDKFLGEYVIYSTRLNFIDVAGDLSGLKIYRESAHKEYAEKDKFSFRLECGVIKDFATWDSYGVPIYLEDGRIMTFNSLNYSWLKDSECRGDIVNQLKKYLSTEKGKLYKFLVVYGGDKDDNPNFMDIVSLNAMADDELLSKFNSRNILDINWWPSSA
jgi:hypothetical protein